jgi:hypothetical protein
MGYWFKPLRVEAWAFMPTEEVRDSSRFSAGHRWNEASKLCV